MHPPDINPFLKGGAYDASETVEAFGEQKAELWKRWKAGESLHGIGRALGKEHHVIHLLLARHGGIAPAARRRGQRALTLAGREDISRGIAAVDRFVGSPKV